MKATEQLVNEHNGIIIVLDVFEVILKKIQDKKDYVLTDVKNILDFLKIFADKCHHGKEEGILFPKLNELGMSKESGPISVMLYEHNLGRKLIKSITLAIEEIESGSSSGEDLLIKSGNNYIELLKNHIQKENSILFPMADRTMTNNEQDEMFNAFEKMENEEIGEGMHEKYHKMIGLLKKTYLE
jgi:hemerythrin-like domain-containing protein